jgi:protein gp37
MGAGTKIQWAHHTFNPWTGCARVSPGCVHCYAETLSKRAPQTFGQWGHATERRVTGDANWRKPLTWDRKAAAAGERHRVFCGSMCDVFEDRPELVEPRERIFGLIEQTPNLDWLLLTKRAEFARDWMTAYVAGDVGPILPDRAPGPPANVWIGVSVEDQQRAGERIPLLLGTPAAIRFLSCEPLLGRVDLPAAALHGEEEPGAWGQCVGYTAPIDWCIVGGESGPGARPMDITWARSIVDQCQQAGVATFVKQLGARPIISGPVLLSNWPVVRPAGDGKHGAIGLRDRKGGDIDEWPHDLRVREFPTPIEGAA